MSGASAAEIQRWAMDVGEWLWGTAQGAFNAEQTTSQILVDAVVGMVPLVGDITAARDLIAVTLQLAEDPRKREEVMQWVLLVVLLFALIPVDSMVGGRWWKGRTDSVLGRRAGFEITPWVTLAQAPRPNMNPFPSPKAPPQVGQ